MRAAIRAITSHDVHDLQSWRPSSDDFALNVRLLVGPEDSPGEESFDITVCSVEWVRRRVAIEGQVDPRHHLIVDKFDWPRLHTYLRRRVEACEGDDWLAVATALARLGHWEFEDYRG